MNDQVRDSLKVTARPENATRPVVEACRTLSDIYAFHRLPFIKFLSYRDIYRTSNSSPPETRGFVIEVKDMLRRYISVAFRVDLPLSDPGIFPSRIPGSPPQISPKGFHLYSSPTRNAQSSFARVSGELEDFDNSKPAMYAVIRVATPEGRRWYGIADEKGRFVVVFPYPSMQDGLTGSPPVLVLKPVFSQSWDVIVEVFYDRLGPLPYTSIPDYLSILSQKRSRILVENPENTSPGGTGSEVFELSEKLKYGKESILRTDGLPKLMVSPVHS